MDTMIVRVAASRSSASIGDARVRARAFIDCLAPSIGAEAAENVVLVLSELVTNALRHAGGSCTLDLTAHPDSIEVAVHDPSPQPPSMRTPGLTRGTGGFGWPLVNRLAHATQVTDSPGGGKTVRAFLPG
ncbi:ATP-binding protein [Streptomyces goshikiensis]|uniref:ATP-binding protein n=1 Tax=Streptomyces goshikiensis TaxID=1942 RepID=UPI003799B6C3